MKRYVIFGAGNLGSVLAAELKQTGAVIGFIDNNKSKWGTQVDGIPVLGNADVLKNLAYDEIVIASTMHFDAIKKDLLAHGITEDKLNKTITDRLTVEIQARVNFLRDFAKLQVDRHPEAAVAEGGVYQGMFSREINRCFPERTLYLFDTFEGFDSRDIKVELGEGLSQVTEHYYGETNQELVLSGLPHKDKAVIKQGYFPETVVGLEDERFLFVNLDFDLYLPILAGLRFFYPRMVDGGVILVHDYFTKFYHGVGKAVHEFECEVPNGILKTPIGDGISIAIYQKGVIK